MVRIERVSAGNPVKSTVALIASSFLAISVSAYLYPFHNPNLIYWVVFGALITMTVVVGHTRKTEQEFVVSLALLWLGGYWSIRDAIVGFYAPQTLFDNVICLLPLALSCFWIRFPKAPWFAYAGLILFDTLTTLWIGDTNNALLTFLIFLALTNVLDKGLRTLMHGALWYQGYLWSSQFLTGYWTPATDYVYFVALTPYLISIINLTIRRMTHNE